jgi:methionine transaminase
MPHFNSPIHSKLPKVRTTIFTKMSQLSNQENAVNLSQGFPDFNCDLRLVELVTKYMRNGQNQYAPMAGVLRLREKIAEKTLALYGTAYHPESEITITAGATQAIYTAIASVVNEDDEVIIFTPAYDCYEPAIELNGGKAVYVLLTAPDYKVNWNQVKKLINQRTKMIIINTPHNPTGTILTENDLQQLEKLLVNTDIIVLSDEVYEHIIFDQQQHQSVARFPMLAERSFIISSFGKTYHTTGWKVGYCLAPKELMAEFRKAHQYIIFSVNTPVQLAYADYMDDQDAYLSLGDFYERKRDIFTAAISNSRFKILPSAGTYFQLLSYDSISEEKDTDFAVHLIKEYKIASIPVSVFYNIANDQKVLRFCFAKSEETLAQAAEIINKI